MRLIQRRATSDEIAIVEAILSSSQDDRSTKLVAQFASCTSIRRTARGPHYRVSVPSTKGDLLVELPRDVVSTPVRTADLLSGDDLAFHVELARGGFFCALVGTSVGQWPRRWKVDVNEVNRLAKGTVTFPNSSDAGAAAISTWLGVSPRSIEFANDGASVDSLQSIGFDAPAELVEALKLSNGFVLKGLAVLATSEAWTVSLDGHTYLIFATLGDGALLATDASGATFESSDPPEDLTPLGMGIRDAIRRG